MYLGWLIEYFIIFIWFTITVSQVPSMFPFGLAQISPPQAIHPLCTLKKTDFFFKVVSLLSCFYSRYASSVRRAVNRAVSSIPRGRSIILIERKVGTPEMDSFHIWHSKEMAAFNSKYCLWFLVYTSSLASVKNRTTTRLHPPDEDKSDTYIDDKGFLHNF